MSQRELDIMTKYGTQGAQSAVSTRELVDALTEEARKVLAGVVEENKEEGLTSTGIRWSGKSLVMAGSMRVWFLFETPDSAEGQTYMRLTPGGYVMSRTPSEMDEVYGMEG